MLRAGEPMVAAWKRVVAGLLGGALHRLRHPGADSAEDIHSVRVAIKHVRALLRLVRPALPEKVFRREDNRLKTAAQRLSALRDTDVGRDLLRDLAEKSHRKSEQKALALVRASYDSAIPETLLQSHEAARRGLVRTLESGRRDLRDLHLEANEWVAVGPGLRAIYRSCRSRMKMALRTGDDPAFHRWRTRLKNLLHALQFLTPIQPGKIARLTRKLTRLHQQIGRDHDLMVLSETLRGRLSEMGDETSILVVLHRVKRERAILRRRIGRLAGGTLNEKPGHLLHRMERRWNTWRSHEG
jgi:CHAD domain-containing protein